MSVIHFSAEELGNVAAWLAQTRFASDDYLPRVCKQLSAYSKGNAAAYNYRHSDGTAKGHKARAILEFARLASVNQSSTDPKQARSTVSLLSYNGPEGEGLTKFRGKAAYQAAMISLLTGAFLRVTAND